MKWLFALALLGAAAGACADPLRGVVIAVIDGDTVLFKPDHYRPSSRTFLKIRLADIDAPEKDQRHGAAATRALKALVLDQRIEADTRATDVYGRRIARLRKGTLDVNAELVRRGHAWASIYRRQAALRDAEAAARAARRGLWQDPNPVPPWTWRRAQPARP